MLKDFWNSKSSTKGESWGVLEIVNGRVNWIWKPESRPDAFVISTKTIVSDNQWHTIKLRNPMIKLGTQQTVMTYHGIIFTGKKFKSS